MKLLLTGFEPFGQHTVNVSAEVVKRLATTEIPNMTLITAVLPVDRYAGPDTLIRAYIQNQPDAVICLGEAGGRAAISIERVAINLLDFRIADNSGLTEKDKPIDLDGHDAYFATLPLRRMATAVQAAGIPVELSLSAGTFLCNQVMYTLLHYLHKHRLNIPAGFIHLPLLPSQINTERPLPSMSLDTVCQGILAVITALSPT